MQITPFKQHDGRVLLNAFSFSSRELDALVTTLKRAGIVWKQEDLPEDKAGRKGLLCIVTAGAVPVLEQYLGVTFEGFEAETTVLVGGGGSAFRCREICRGGDGPGCVDIVARDDVEALAKCALVANNKKWFGSAAQSGRCLHQ